MQSAGRRWPSTPRCCCRSATSVRPTKCACRCVSPRIFFDNKLAGSLFRNESDHDHEGSGSVSKPFLRSLPRLSPLCIVSLHNFNSACDMLACFHPVLLKARIGRASSLSSIFICTHRILLALRSGMSMSPSGSCRWAGCGKATCPCVKTVPTAAAACTSVHICATHCTRPVRPPNGTKTEDVGAEQQCRSPHFAAAGAVRGSDPAGLSGGAVHNGSGALQHTTSSMLAGSQFGKAPLHPRRSVSREGRLLRMRCERPAPVMLSRAEAARVLEAHLLPRLRSSQPAPVRCRVVAEAASPPAAQPLSFVINPVGAEARSEERVWDSGDQRTKLVGFFVFVFCLLSFVLWSLSNRRPLVHGGSYPAAALLTPTGALQSLELPQL